jgi:hypothetical protein
MKRLIAATIGACCSLTASGENLLQCVDPDVQQGLLFRGSGAIPEISDEMPLAIAALPKPPDLVWIGSRSGSDMGAFRTSGDPVEVFDAVLGELDRDGWDEESRMMRPNGQQLLVACRDDQDVTVISWQYANFTYVTYTVRAVVETSVCSSAARRSRPGSLALDSVLPKLDFDAIHRSARTGRAAGAWGGQASGFRYTLVTIDADLATLASGLSDQLLGQGWRAETSWSGGGMAGSTWLVEDRGKRYVGALDVIDVGDSSFNVAISIEEQRL